METIQPSDEAWIRRCFTLASRGIGYVSPNPPVGAVLVYNGHVLGEGYHTAFGQPHAEVEAIQAVSASDRHLIPKATLYVSLEPCCIANKTPPCTNLILAHGIKDVRVSIMDPNPAVSGKGLALLNEHGVSVISGILASAGIKLIRSFATNILKQRPHVVLKWAQSKYGYLGLPDQPVWMSHPDVQLFTHRLRHETDAILIGARTVINDNPRLTVRDYPGRSPHRVVYDPEGRLHQPYHVFENDGKDIFYFSKTSNPLLTSEHIHQCMITGDEKHAGQILEQLYAAQIGYLMVEGGAFVHHLFIKEGLWDEAWVIQTQHDLSEGIKAPVIRGKWLGSYTAGTDRIIGIENERSAG